MIKKFIKNLIPQKYHLTFFIVWVKLNRINYIGNKVKCPCCNSHFRAFMPFYQGNKEVDSICMKCLSFSRHRYLWLFLLNRTEIFTKKLKVLHIAPEYFLNKVFSKLSNLEYTTIDICPGRAKETMNATSLNFPSNNFDVIIAIHILEHIEEDRKAISEFYRVLKPGGWAIIEVPIDNSREITYENRKIQTPREREKEFHQEDHVRICGKDYLQRILEPGFTLKADTYMQSIDDNLKRIYCLFKNERICLYFKE